VKGVRVRAAGTDDLDAVISLEAHVFGEEAWSPRSVEAEFAAQGHSRVILVAERSGEVVGYAVLMHVGDAGDLQRVAVDPGHRHQGVGRLLVRKVFAAARQLGLSELMLEVADGNVAASSLYKQLGFSTIDRRRGYYRAGGDALVMRRTMRAVSDG
jgi:ribosomal-protein-alanine N-acetyltransferase